MARKNKRNELLEKSKKSYLRKSGVTIGVLALGGVILCAFLAMMQNYSVEQSQKDTSFKILSEVTETMKNNDETVKSITHEFNELNQTTLQTLNTYMKSESVNFFDGQYNVSSIGLKLESLSKDIGSDNIYIISGDGLVITASDISLGDKSVVGKNVKDTFGEEGLAALTGYEKDSNDNPIVDGTIRYGEKVEYHPVFASYNGYDYYTYSVYFASSEYGGTNTDFFLLTSVNSKLLDKELSSIKDIGSVLDGVSVGKTGFLFSVDTDSETFSYFNNGKQKLTGENYVEHGFNSYAAVDKYVGYQTVGGVRYYCTTAKFQSETFGEFTVIAAVVAADELVGKIITTVVISSAAFLIVAAIVIGYGMIIRHDIADRTIALEAELVSELRDEVEGGRSKFTEDEIQERVKIRMEETIEKNADKQLSRVNFGTRNAKGVQTYFSTYMLKKVSPVMIIGAGVIFLISFFSQTLLAYQEAINLSTVGINDVQQIINKNEATADSIRSYISEQYLSKLKLISYLMKENPEEVLTFDKDNDDVHPLTYKTENGKREVLTDKEGHVRYSVEYNQMLQSVCSLNNLSSIYVYDEDGYCIATNTEYWYNHAYEEERLLPITSIIEGKTDFEIEDVDFGTDKKIDKQYIAYVMYYYTTIQNNEIKYVGEASYNNQTVDQPVFKHRAAVQIDISIKDFLTLFEVTQVSYILKNLHVYGEDSFFVAFDTSEDHVCIYSPVASSIGKTAQELNVSDKCFKLVGTYNGFTNVNGNEYYQTYMLVGDYYFATTIPTSYIHSTRNVIASYTLLFSSIFIIIAAGFYIFSTDKADKEYIDYLRLKEDQEERKNAAFIISSAAGNKKTTSASSRYTKVLWKHKTVEQKLASILMGYLFAASIIILLVLLNIVVRNDNNSIFAYIFSGEWDRGFNIFSLTAALMVAVLVIAASNFVKIIVKSFCGALGARVETLGNLFVSVVKYGGMIGGLFYCLYLFGFDTTSLLTSAGILTVVVGLGAQSLISDIIAGMFIVFEGEFRVGDIVTIGDFRGQVIEIGLRTTKLLDIANNIKIFNNASISGVLNMTKESSFAFVTVGIEYGESLERVEAVLSKGFPKIRKKLPAIVEGPYYKGVLALNTSSVDIGIVARCAEQDRVQLARDLNREIFLLFKANNVNIPFPQVTVSYLKDEEHTRVTPQEIKEAKKFAEEEKEKSQDINVKM